MPGENRNRELTGEAAAQLQEGINLVLSRWHALQAAVENEWGGPNSRQLAQQLPQDLFQLLTQYRDQVYVDDVEDKLDDFMLTLNTEIEDGSIEEVAEKLMVIHEECLEGNFSSIHRLRETNPPPRPHVRQAAINEEDDSEDDDSNLEDNNSSGMEIDAPTFLPSSNQNETTVNRQNPNEVAEVEDGWTMVTSRRNRGRNN